MKTWHMVTYMLVVVGALNWGLVGLFNFNLVSTLFGAWPGLERLLYILVGVSSVYEFATHMNNCKLCAKK